MDKKEPPERIRKGGIAPLVSSTAAVALRDRIAEQGNERPERLAFQGLNRKEVSSKPTAWLVVDTSSKCAGIGELPRSEVSSAACARIWKGPDGVLSHPGFIGSLFYAGFQGHCLNPFYLLKSGHRSGRPLGRLFCVRPVLIPNGNTCYHECQ